MQHHPHAYLRNVGVVILCLLEVLLSVTYKLASFDMTWYAKYLLSAITNSENHLREFFCDIHITDQL